MSNLVTVTHRDVLKDGFGLLHIADAGNLLFLQKTIVEVTYLIINHTDLFSEKLKTTLVKSRQLHYFSSFAIC